MREILIVVLLVVCVPPIVKYMISESTPENTPPVTAPAVESRDDQQAGRYHLRKRTPRFFRRSRNS